MSLLQNALESGKFAVTAEMAPPKGYDFTEQLQVAASSRRCTRYKRYGYAVRLLKGIVPWPVHTP